MINTALAHLNNLWPYVSKRQHFPHQLASIICLQHSRGEKHAQHCVLPWSRHISQTAPFPPRHLGPALSLKSQDASTSEPTTAPSGGGTKAQFHNCHGYDVQCIWVVCWKRIWGFCFFCPTWRLSVVRCWHAGEGLPFCQVVLFGFQVIVMNKGNLPIPRKCVHSALQMTFPLFPDFHQRSINWEASYIGDQPAENSCVQYK